MNYPIKPYTGVGKINFDMTVTEVRKTLEAESETSKKSGKDVPSDFFESLGIFVDYRLPGICHAVEFAGPASPTFEGQELLGRPFNNFASWIKTLDRDVIVDDAGLKSIKYGFGVYAPSAKKNPELPIEGVIVFDRDYYQ